MEAGNYTTRIARVFAEGSACFPPTFLTAIEYTRNAEESSSAQGRLAHPTVEDITPKSAAGIDEVVSSDESDDEVSENQSDQDDTYVEGVRPSRKRKEGPATNEKTTNKKQKTTDHLRKRPYPSNFPLITEETSAVNA
ncbi:hypothetical protein CLAFUW4_14116 [Fulvia fulva]|uniref:Uncharacterized protein n=1 Tax=Passalora fulva TaxID=5499 RepID=A0A9Q8PLB6_PASFU|nr:uncharacterized protein CLAFUR5_13950 [Fulvia fulva]KAK4610350.1 hypothetical protein CLAFUR4_14119 [Fulvia fulva]KAK4611024.1 hypothetical protein CLAFUR0_14123 [Fulvia fulva]UJO24573.1 hypothetical protein CLAFUR5_13950 [Fulvia fulva]WPV21873.1 hypothetical protein CLAFUW4_14116 [Fulvia fulva]WPV37346.1 hypothetical protein CLAFUW7_14127 [Fulvia fulva]